MPQQPVCSISNHHPWHYDLFNCHCATYLSIYQANGPSSIVILVFFFCSGAPKLLQGIQIPHILIFFSRILKPPMGFRPTPPTSRSLQSQRKRRRSPAEDTATPIEEALVCDHFGDYGMMSLMMTVGIRNAYLETRAPRGFGYTTLCHTNFFAWVMWVTSENWNGG